MGGQGEFVPMPVLEEVTDLDDGRPYPVITGDYSATPGWEYQPVVVGTPVAKPTPVFTKFDPSVVEEEIERMRREDQADGEGQADADGEADASGEAAGRMSPHSSSRHGLPTVASIRCRSTSSTTTSTSTSVVTAPSPWTAEAVARARAVGVEPPRPGGL